MSERTTVAVVGASGYVGAELLRLLYGHPRVTVTSVTARRAAGQRLDESFPHLRGVSSATIDAFDADEVAAKARVVFSALPHGESAVTVAALRQRGAIVVDLSADFRLRDEATWCEWYGSAEHPHHPAAARLAEAVYGLPELGELARAALRTTDLIAAPGCYPTASILAIAPLLRAGLVEPDGIVVDAKSGVSGMGRSPVLGNHFAEMGEGIRAYKAGGGHRHTPEIEQALHRVSGSPLAILFTPHLVPMARGILSCVYARARDDGDPDRFRAALATAYAGEPFVSVLPAGQHPDTAHVRGSNRVHVTAFFDRRSRRVVAMSALDNLVKGAAGQAVQCLNVRLGWDETLGLEAPPLFP